MDEIKELREEIARLRERIAVLENRADHPVLDGHPLWKPNWIPGTGDPMLPPYVVTC